MKTEKVQNKLSVDTQAIPRKYQDFHHWVPHDLKVFYIVTILAMSLLATGCYSHISMSKVPPGAESLVPAATENRSFPAYISSIQVKLNGTPTNISPTFEARLVGRLQETRLFSDVVSILGRERRPNEPHSNLTLHIEEVQHLHSFSNGIKGFFVGVSLFLLSPVLPYSYGHEVNMKLFERMPNGIEKQYLAESRGNIYYTMDRARQAISELQGKVVEACIISLMNQLISNHYHRIQD